MGNKTLREMTGYEGYGHLIPFNNTLHERGMPLGIC